MISETNQRKQASCCYTLLYALVQCLEYLAMVAVAKTVLLAILSLLAFNLHGCADCKGIYKKYVDCQKKEGSEVCDKCKDEVTALKDICDCKCEDMAEKPDDDCKGSAKGKTWKDQTKDSGFCKEKC